MDMVEREHIPSYNFRPKEEDIILARAKWETYFSRARVDKVSSQAIVSGLTSCQFVVPQMVWSQDSQTVLLRVTITSMRDITHGQVFVGPGADCPGAGGECVSDMRSLLSTQDFTTQAVWEGGPIDVYSYEIKLVDCRKGTFCVIYI